MATDGKTSWSPGAGDDSLDFRYVEGKVTVAGETRYAIRWKKTGLVQFMDMANRLRRAVPTTAKTFERGN